MESNGIQIDIPVHVICESHGSYYINIASSKVNHTLVIMAAFKYFLAAVWLSCCIDIIVPFIGIIPTNFKFTPYLTRGITLNLDLEFLELENQRFWF